MIVIRTLVIVRFLLLLLTIIMRWSPRKMTMIITMLPRFERCNSNAPFSFSSGVVFRVQRTACVEMLCKNTPRRSAAWKTDPNLVDFLRDLQFLARSRFCRKLPKVMILRQGLHSSSGLHAHTEICEVPQLASVMKISGWSV